MRKDDLAKLNMQFRYSRCEDILNWIIENKFPDMAMTSSFQASGVVLIDIMRGIVPDFPIYFIDTGYHFPETLEFRDRLIHEWDLNVITVKPDPREKSLREAKKEPLYKRDPDRCCLVNKVEPLNRLKKRLNVTAWMAAVRRDQNSNREGFSMFMYDRQGYVRIHPLIHWSGQKIWQYIHEKKLPFHPLYDKGYTSIGCFPPECTSQNHSSSDPRKGRWTDTKKTECGLHLDLVKEEENAWIRQLNLRESKNEKKKTKILS
jgi:phosphoadenosine phosphosulfate reductase